jgi:hypothetical protein
LTASITTSSTDAAGVITTDGTESSVVVTFHVAYGTAPRVFISPGNVEAAQTIAALAQGVTVTSTANNFTLTYPAPAGTGCIWNYVVIGNNP